MNRYLILLLALIFSQILVAQNAGYIDNQPATANKAARLQLELVNTEPVPVGTEAWWRCIRVPHQLADEGNGLYTCFFSAYDKTGEFESIGKATFRVKEIVEEP